MSRFRVKGLLIVIVSGTIFLSSCMPRNHGESNFSLTDSLSPKETSVSEETGSFEETVSTSEQSLQQLSSEDSHPVARNNDECSMSQIIAANMNVFKAYVGGENGAYRTGNGRIRYLDYASGQEIYLCSQPGCRHTDDSCTAYFMESYCDMCYGFIWDEKVFWLLSDSDSDGSIMTGDGEWDLDVLVQTKAPRVVVMDLDGKNRRTAVEFSSGEVIGDPYFFCGVDGTNLYLIIKQLDAVQVEDGSIYTGTVSSRLYACNYVTGEKQALCEIPSGMRPIACSGEYLIAECTESVLQLQKEGVQDIEAIMKARRDGSRRCFVRRNINTGETETVFTIGSSVLTSLVDTSLYYIDDPADTLVKISLLTGESEIVMTVTETYLTNDRNGLLMLWKSAEQGIGRYLTADGEVMEWKGFHASINGAEDSSSKPLSVEIYGTDWCLVRYEAEEEEEYIEWAGVYQPRTISERWGLIRLKDFAEGDLTQMKPVTFLEE